MIDVLNKRLLMSGAALGTLLAISPATAFAQNDNSDDADDAPVPEMVMVTGVRQAYRGNFQFLETPQSEQIIDQQILKDTGTLDLVTALDLSASVARQNNFGGLWNSFAIRGFAGDENLPSNYLVNGFNAGRGFAGPRDIAGLETVEVLKGPKSALFGRGEPGGTINLVTKRPTFETGGNFTLTAGRFGQYRGDVDVDLAVSDTVGVRLVGFYEEAESFRETVETKRFGFYPSVNYRPNESTRLVYELEYSEQEVPFDRGVPAINNELGTIPIETFLGEPGNGPNETKVFGHQFEIEHDFSDNWNVLIGFNYRDTFLEGFETGPTLSASRQFLFIDGENLSRERRSRQYDAEYYVIRGEIAGEFDTGDLRHRVLIGMDYDNFDNQLLFRRARGGAIQPGEVATDPAVAQRLQVINVFNPVFGQFPLPETSPQTDRTDIQRSLGIFIQDQITITDRLDIRLGFRFDDSSQELINRLGTSVPNSSASRFSPQVGIVYQLSDHVSAYASYGEGFRQLLGLDIDNQPLEPNITRSFEAGVKFGFFDGALQGSAAVFNITQENILSVSDAFELTSAGEAQSTGFEFDLSGSLTDSISIWLSYAYTDAATENEFFDANFGVTIPADAPLVNIPDHQLSFQAIKDFDPQDVPLRVGGGLLYVSERSGQFGDFFGQGVFNLPGYVTIRAFAEYNLTEAITVRADVENLMNEDIFLNSFASLWVQPGAPRTWRISLGYSF